MQIEVGWLEKRQAIRDERSGENKMHRSQRFRSQHQQTVRLLGLSRSSWYRPKIITFESNENLELMRLIDEEFLWHPYR